MRVSADVISSTRADRLARVLLTGATGFLGSYLAASLIRDGHKLVLLCRSRDGVSAEERISRVMGWHGVEDWQRATVVEGDLQQPLFGLSAKEFASLANDVDEIIHCASETSFEERDREQIFATNLSGVERILDLASAGSCYFVHYMSTAYVAGRNGTAVCSESLDYVQDFHNPYEASKHGAECRVADRCAAAGIRACIYRPSIIIGDSVTGKALLFNAMYYPVRIGRYLADSFRKDIAANRGELACRMGATLLEDGRLRVPVRIDGGCGGDGIINLVPIDYVVAAFRAIQACALDGGVFHIVSPRPVHLTDLIAFSNEYLQVDGFTACQSSAFVSKPKSALERRFDAYVRPYLPYMSDTRQFDSSHADTILGPAGIQCPEVDYQLFSRCIQYALECDWRSPQESL